MSFSSSPPPPPPFYPIAVIFILLSSSLHLAAASSHPCSKSSSSSSSCPPFKSALSYPFSSTPGCGHPFFQINCSSSPSSSTSSIITINNLSFRVLNYIINSSSLFLSPQPAHTSPKSQLESAQNRICSSTHYPSIPRASVNLSGTPFRVAETSCSRLSALKPCLPESPAKAPNCSLCEWECKVSKTPFRIFHDCKGHDVSEQVCRNDVLGYLDYLLLNFGVEVQWDEEHDAYFTQCRSCVDKKGACGFDLLDKDKGFICFHPQQQQPWIRRHYADRISIICATVILLSLLFITVAVITFRIRRLKSVSESEEDPTAVFLHHHRSPNLLPPIFTYEELEAATNKFDLKCKIGDGGFGSVFLGNLRDGRIVAVKYLHRHPGVPGTGAANRALFTKSFCNEILILSSIDHPNLVKLYGYCSDPRGLLLVYDYVPNGTLADHLHGGSSMKPLNKKKTPLKWEVRFEIALQTAIAMKYLHFDVSPSIVHRDITSSNIFIEKDMTVKIGDFGLSRLLIWDGGSNNNHSSNSANGCVWTGPQGTPGYLDPDYYKSFRLTEKSDVYSFGVVLLELVTGLRAVDQNRAKREVALADHVVERIHKGLMNQVVDVDLIVNGQVLEGVSAVAELAFRCVAADKDDRPDSKEVVEELKRIGSRIGGCLTRVSSSISDAGLRI